MNLFSVKLTNFLSHKDTVLNLSASNLVVIVGENGAGKSTLVKDSVTWALFGKARASSDDVIYNNESFAEVRLGFYIGAVPYEVIRYRERGKRSTLSLFEADQELTGATIAETQGKIEALLGMTYEIFVSTACIEQGKADSFSTLPPKEAKNVIMGILQLGEYDKYLKVAREHANELSGELIAKEGEQYAGQNTIESLQHTIEELSCHRVASESLRSSQAQDKEKLKHIEVEFDKLDDTLRSEDVESSKLTVYIRQLKDAKAIVEDKITKVQTIQEKGKCPLCLSQLDKAGVDLVVQEFTRRHTMYRVEIDSTEEKLRELVWRQEGVSLASNKLRLQKSKLQESLDEIANELQKSQEQVGFLSAKEEELKQLKENMFTVSLRVKEISRLYSHYAILTKAFDKHGIPTLVIENVIPELEENTNRILAVLSNDMRLELRTQKTLKSGGVGDTLEITIKGLTGNRSYAMLSGGEKFRIDLALRIALSTVLSRRNNFKCETLIIDEGFGSLDEIGKQSFVELSKSLHTTFKRIILITHTDLTERYEDLLEVKKINGVSRINQVQPVSTPS